jgi:hypothetical protein
MTYMTDAPTAEHPVPMSSHPVPTGAAAGTLSSGHYRLPSPGGRPVAFAGSELAMAMSFKPELPYWYEINLYRANDGSFPVAIKQFFQSSEETDVIRAWVTPTLDAAIQLIEEYDPAHDVPVPMSLFSTDMTAAELEAAAMDLQAQVAHARTHYRTLVGEFLHDLDGA